MQKQYSSPAFTGWQQLQSKAVLIIKEKNCQEKEWYILYKLRVNMSHCNFGNKGKAANPDYPSIFTVYSAFYIMTAGMQAFCVSVHLLLAFEVSPYNINCFTKCAAPLCFPCRLTEMENLFYVIDPCVICVAVNEWACRSPFSHRALTWLHSWLKVPYSLSFVLCIFDQTG